MQITALTLILEFLLLPLLVAGQLSGRVGPLTSIAAKRAKKVCDVTKFGATASKTADLGPALRAAFAACKMGGVIVIPPGDYGLSTWVTMGGGSGWALQWDGIIYRTGSAPGNMLLVSGAADVEIFSSTGRGAFQGYGYQTGGTSGPRILRFVKTNNFAVHNLAFADSPSFFFTLDSSTNGEVYNMAIRGRDLGGLDGIDIWSRNIHVHDVMVTNRDECVTVKSPSSNILIENIYCNWSGGSAFGSLIANTAISFVTYRNIYTVRSNQMMMIKSNGGTGYLRNVLLENFIGHGNLYSLDVDQQWSNMKRLPGNGVQLSDITIKGWRGTAANGVQRGPVKFNCAAGAPCTGMTVADFSMWTDTGSSILYTCANAFGQGACLKAGNAAPYPTITTTIRTVPASFRAPVMPGDLKASFGTNREIPIPAIPSSFFPNTAPLRKSAVSSEEGGQNNAQPIQDPHAEDPQSSQPPHDGTEASGASRKRFVFWG